MYADRVDAQANRSIKERLDGISSAGSGFLRNISGKRRREYDDKWEHGLFESKRPKVSNLRVGANDLRLKLQKKIVGQSAQHVRGSASGGARDLREKLNPAPESSKPPRSNVVAVAPERELKKIANSVTKKKPPQKVVTVDSFLESLGLEKYSISFQAEEVDMTALVHMSDEDLKAMGIPMGPRKKIRLGLESKV